jgi:hypothetical protein
MQQAAVAVHVCVAEARPGYMLLSNAGMHQDADQPNWQQGVVPSALQAGDLQQQHRRMQVRAVCAQ